MIGRLFELLTQQRRDEDPAPEDEVRLASAALLVETAASDGHFDAAERDAVQGALRDRFGLSEKDAAALVAGAEEKVAQSTQILPFTKAIKDNLSHEDRVRLMEMLWEVVYADGRLHHYESNLMRRVAGLIYVSDQESGAARKRALARLGLSSESHSPPGAGR